MADILLLETSEIPFLLKNSFPHFIISFSKGVEQIIGFDKIANDSISLFFTPYSLWDKTKILFGGGFLYNFIISSLVLPLSPFGFIKINNFLELNKSCDTN